MLNSADIKTTFDWLKESKHIVITSHKSPDGDSIGSSLGLYWFLKSIGISSTICHPDKMPHFLSWLEGADHILSFDNNENEVTQKLNEADLIFSLDYNHPSRIGLLEPLFKESKAKKVMIDHHQSPDTSSFDILFSDTESCSTSQLIYEFFEGLGKTDVVNETSGTPLYCGIMTDTGSFRFPSTTAKTHRIIASLIEKGVKNSQVHEKVFDSNSVNRLQLNGYALSSKLNLIMDGEVGYIALSQDELNRFDYQKGDTEGLVNQILSIKGVKLAVFFKEDENMIKISFRSKGNTYVNELAREYFNGGGHVYAAGGRFIGHLDQAIDKFVTTAPKYVK